jgi:hypothetical protein
MHPAFLSRLYLVSKNRRCVYRASTQYPIQHLVWGNIHKVAHLASWARLGLAIKMN